MALLIDELPQFRAKIGMRKGYIIRVTPSAESPSPNSSSGLGISGDGVLVVHTAFSSLGGRAGAPADLIAALRLAVGGARHARDAQHERR